MPNHITTVLYAEAEVLNRLTDEDGNVDFNTVIPMPDDDDPMFTATRTEFGGGMVGYSFDGYSPMNWATGNWGTKWNAYDQDRFSDNSVRFDTAWSHPFPVVEALSRLFPTETITVKYADEDLGSNLGEYDIRDGVIVEDRTLPGDYHSTDRLDFATDVKYGQTYAEYEEQNRW